MKKIRILFVLIIVSCQIAWGLTVPELNGKRINDYANILTQSQITQLENKLQLFEDSTSNQIAILIIPSLEGEIMEEYAVKVFEKWELGDKEKDNGLLFLISINDRQSRIEVGNGLEGVMTDLKSSQVTKEIIPSFFQKNQHFEGIDSSLLFITTTIGDEYSANKGKILGLPPMYWLIGLIIYILIFTLIGIATGEPLLALYFAFRILAAVASSGGGGGGGFSGGGGSSSGGGSSGSW